ncbi:g1.3 [Ichnoviriform fugitivi]|uniref:G1.3 n=1 Tax=Ichnoviriform fugitivi TaxID=265522 RepID=A2Q0P9_9VIRU|nr:g1.3 [Ichnoviriform fugitivi]BAF45764.1 g1.3 [Ichnoviriform fugitivi]
MKQQQQKPLSKLKFLVYCTNLIGIFTAARESQQIESERRIEDCYYPIYHVEYRDDSNEMHPEPQKTVDFFIERVVCEDANTFRFFSETCQAIFLERTYSPRRK